MVRLYPNEHDANLSIGTENITWGNTSLEASLSLSIVLIPDIVPLAAFYKIY